METVGTKAQVFKGLAKHTSGGLTKSDIFFDKVSGTYKSKSKSKSSAGNPWSEAVGIWMRANPNNRLIPKKGTRGYSELRAIYDGLK